MLAAVIAVVCSAQPLEVQVAAMRFAWNVPGVVVAVIRPGHPPQFITAGHTRLTDSELVTPDTIFAIGSCTKSFTSALAAKLADEQQFDLDASTRKYLPDFHLADPIADRLVTPRDLLSHRTGVEGHDLLWYRVPWSQANAVARLGRLAPVGEFRKSYHYSSLQYLAVAQALEVAGKKPWAELVAERLTRPLGMMATTFVTPDQDRNRALGYRRGKDGLPEPMPEYRLTEPNAAGSIYSSARDLARWAEFQLGQGQFRGQRIIAEDHFRETHTPHIAMPLTDLGIAPSYPATTHVDYCQGWVRYDHRGINVIAHGGVADGFRTQITLLPNQKSAIVVLSNLHQSMCNLTITNMVIDKIAGLAPYDWSSHFLQVEAGARKDRHRQLVERDGRRGTVVPPLVLSRYCGIYHEPAYGRASVTERDGRLHLKWGGIDTRLEPYTGHYFRICAGPGEDELVEFAPERTPKAMKVFGRVFQIN